MGSSPQRGGSFALQYFSNFTQSHSLVFNLSAGVMGRNFEFVIPKEEFDPPADIDIRNSGIVARNFDLVFVGIGIAGEKRWMHNKTAVWKAQGGLQLQYSPSSGGTTRFHLVQQNQVTTFLSFELFDANKQKPWLNYFAKGGHLWILKNQNLVMVDVGGKVSFKDFATGSYSFDIPNKPSVKGNYRLSGSHIFIEFSYVFTAANKNLKKLERNNF